MRISALLLEILIIQIESPIRILLQRGVQDLQVGVLGCVQEISIGRCIQEYLLVRSAKRLCQLIESRDDTGSEAKFFLREIPAIVVHAPPEEGLIVAIIINSRIAKDPSIQSGADSVEDIRRNAELHVSNPHSNKLFILVRKDLVRAGMEDVLTEALCIQRIGISAIDNLIKIVHFKTPYAC